jgi:hypothetical protein
MHIPLNLLPPLNAGETERDRKNLHLRTKDGSIDADIWLIGQEEVAPKDGARTTVSLSSSDGNITAKIVSADPFRLMRRLMRSRIRSRNLLLRSSWTSMHATDE